MATNQQTTKITQDSQGITWTEISETLRCDFVLQWCKDNDVNTALTTAQLQAAMHHMPYWAQGPADYLDFVTAFNAATAATEE